jgi:thioredoxin-like negative regulator of GroEL
LAERGKEAEKEFQDIAKKYPHTKPGKIAKYMAGAAALDAGDTADAEKQLKDAADMSNKDVASLAKLALANVYRVTNRQGEAAKIYKDLSDHPTDTVSKTQAQLELAQMYETTDPKQAQSLYQQIQKENPNTSAAQIAAGKLVPGAANK